MKMNSKKRSTCSPIKSKLFPGLILVILFFNQTWSEEAGSLQDFSQIFETIKREASPEELYTFLYDMPKGGDLHHHHGGSTITEAWYKVATDPELNDGQRYYTRNRIMNCGEDATPPGLRKGSKSLMYWVNINERSWQKLNDCPRSEYKPIDELTDGERRAWMSSLILDRPGESQNEFFEYQFPRINELSRNPYLMSELVVDNMKRFGAEGLLYFEPQVSVFSRNDKNGNPLSPHQVYKIYKERINRPDALATGVTVRFQLTVLRFAPDALERVGRTFEFIDSHRDLWRGINMAGREDNERGHPQRFTEAYDQALRKYPGIGISIHAGEENEPSEHIIDTLRLGATRIGHGINLIDDRDTMMLMRTGRFFVEINLISNELLGYVDSIAEHPFPIYLRQGIPVGLSTDDRGMWDSNMTDEFYVAVTQFNLSWEEIMKIGKYSLKFSFAQTDVKKKLLEEYRKKMETFAQKYSTSDWRQPLKSVKAVTYGYGQKRLGLKL